MFMTRSNPVRVGRRPAKRGVGGACATREKRGARSVDMRASTRFSGATGLGCAEKVRKVVMDTYLCYLKAIRARPTWVRRRHAFVAISSSSSSPRASQSVQLTSSSDGMLVEVVESACSWLMSDYVRRITAIWRVWGRCGGGWVYLHALHVALRCDAMRCDAMRCDAMWDVGCEVSVESEDLERACWKYVRWITALWIRKRWVHERAGWSMA